MAKAGVFVNVVGKVDASAFARARRELDQLERKTTTSGQRIAQSFKNAGDQLAQVGDKANRAGSKLTTGATLPILAAGAASFKFASDLNESMSKANVVFGKNSAAIDKWASNAATNLGISKQEALEASSTFGNFLTALGVGSGPTAKMSKGITQLGVDLASFNNVSNPTEVLDALRSGMAGEAEPLRKFGVNLNAARIEAEALNLGLAKAPVNMAKVRVATTNLEKAQLAAVKATKEHGAESLEARAAAAKVAAAEEQVRKALAGSKVELTAAQKAQATYSLIMKDTKLAQGDFARTSDGAAGQMKKLTAKAKDAAAAFGTQLLPIGLKVLDWAQKLLGWFSNLSPHAQKMIVIVGGIVAALGPLLKIFGTVSKVAGGFATGLGKLGPLFTKVGAGFTKLGAVMMAHPFVAIAAVVIALGVALFTLYKKNERFRRFVDAAWRKIKEAFADAWEKIRPVLLAIGRFMTEKVAPAIRTGIDAIVRIFTAATAPILAIWSAIGDDLWRIIKTAFNFIVNSVRNGFNFVRGLFEFFINLVQGKWGAAWDGLKRAFKALWSQIGNILRSGFSLVRSLFGAGFSLLGKIFGGALRSLGRLAGNLLGKVIDYFVKLPGRALTGIGNIGKFIWDGIRTGFTNLKTNVGNLLNDIVDFFRKLPGRIGRFITKIASAGLDIGRNLVQGILDGFKAAAGFALDIAGAIFDGLKRFVNEQIIDRINNAIPDKIKGPGPLPDLDLPDNPIPRLAHGAVIHRPTLALVGEDSRTTPEIVSPERLLRRIVRDETQTRSALATVTIGPGAVQIDVKVENPANAIDVAAAVETGVARALGDLAVTIERGAAA